MCSVNEIVLYGHLKEPMTVKNYFITVPLHNLLQSLLHFHNQLVHQNRFLQSRREIADDDRVFVDLLLAQDQREIDAALVRGTQLGVQRFFRERLENRYPLLPKQLE